MTEPATQEQGQDKITASLPVHHLVSSAQSAAADLQKKFKYHHGNLREALLAAATDILMREGIDQLSLRALAKATGVTQAAPYSHFRDKDELLAAIAEAGFQRLAGAMAEAASGAPTKRARIERLMTAYIHFAQEQKPLFQIMFGRELEDMKRYPSLAMTAGKSYALFSAALAKGSAEDVRYLTLGVWSFCHGLTTLLIENKVSPRQFGAEDLESFVRRSLDLFDQKLA